jgi:tRNA(Arg) A34 adenosine deaminase TadA
MTRKPSLSKELQAAEHYARLAMAQAELAVRSGNAPFGAVIVDTLGDVVAAEHNRVQETFDPSAHAEINAIRVACRRMRMPTLEGYRLYVDKEPCPMCLVCAIEAKLSAVYYGDPDDGWWAWWP